MNLKRKPGEKKRKKLLNFYAFLEDNSKLTYGIRSWIENDFQTKKESVKKELNLDGWILDIACGGGVLNDVVPHDRYIGIDMSKSVIHHAANTHDGYFMPMIANRLGFHDESFESCVAMDVFHHIEKKYISGILEEINRVLTPSGRFLVTDPVRAHFFKDPLNATLQRMDRGNHFRSPELLRALLKRTFDIEHFYLSQGGFVKCMVFVLKKKSSS